jgi:hypothetical protein
MIRIAAGIAALLLFQSHDNLYYRAPDNVDPDDLPKAMAAFSARCKAYGYKGIQTAIVDRACRKVIQVSCESGLTDEMKRTLDILSQLGGTSVELRFPAYLKDVEKEQYQARPNPCDDTSPPGASWYRFKDCAEPAVLLRDSPLITKNEIQFRTVKDKSGSPRVFWELTALQTREIRELERKGKLGTPYLLLDGVVVEAVPLMTLEKNDEGKIVPAQKLSFTPVLHVVQVALANPLPFALQNEEVSENP